MIECMNVYKRYPTGTNALYDINVKVEQGEFIYIIGPTGSGKSTLIKLLDGEEKATKGKVKVVGIDVGTLRRSQIPIYRRNIGVVFQDFRLLPTKTVFENISYALEVINMKKKMIRIRVKEIMDVVGLSEKGNAFPAELSGGQQQRVAIARAIANRPKVLIADEPTGNLDPGKSDEIMELLERINETYGTTILMVTHRFQRCRQTLGNVDLLGDRGGDHPDDHFPVSDLHVASAGIHQECRILHGNLCSGRF